MDVNKVLVRLPPGYVKFSSHPYSIGYWLDEPLYEWLREHIGMGSQAGVVVEIDVWAWLHVRDVLGNPVHNMLRFNNRVDAMKFKLTWP